MIGTTYDDNEDDTIYGFSPIKKPKYIKESPQKSNKSIAFSVPRFNSHMMASAKKEIRNDDTIIAIINLVVSGLSFIQHAIFFNNNYVSTDFCNYIREFILILSISSNLWIIRRYQIKLIMLLIRYKVSSKDTIFSVGLYKPMLFEMFLALLVIPPYVDYTFAVNMLGFTITYSISAIFTFISMLKLYVFTRLFGHYTEYTQEKAENICSKHSVTANAYFALKCTIQESPFVGIVMFFFLMSMISSLTLQLSEQPQRYPFGAVSPSSSTLSEIYDCLWVIFFTTTTIGYGNLYPFTHTGRGACIIACILGNMYLGLLVVTMNNKLKHDDSQNLSYAWVSRMYIKQDIRKHAKNAIRKAATLYLLNKKWNGKAISPIKPNGKVVYKRVVVKNDMARLSNQQYFKKVCLYRELRNSLESLKGAISQARTIGQSDFDIIHNFEDVIRIEFPAIQKKIKGKVNTKHLNAAEEFSNSCKPLEAKAASIKEFSKALRRRLAHKLRRKTSVNNVPININRGSVRKLTN